MTVPQILVIDPIEDRAAMLARALQQRKHSVTVWISSQAPADLGRVEKNVDVVIVDLSRNRPSDWHNLDQIMTAVSAHSPRPMVLCLSDVYRGPAMKLEVERRGGRFTWI